MLFKKRLYFLLELAFFCNNFPAIQPQWGIGTLPSEEDDITRFDDGGGIWRMSEGCISACRGVSWKPVLKDGDFVMEFRLSTSDSKNYMAMAISKDTKMGDDDVYVCARNGSTFMVRSGYLTEHSKPVLGSPEEPDDHLLFGGHASCTFTRPLLVSRTVNGVVKKWDVTINAVNILYAEGPTDSSGQILKHTFSASTSHAFDLLRTANYKPQPSQMPSTIPAEEISPERIDLTSTQVNDLDNIIATPGYTDRGVWYVPNESCKNSICKSVNWQLLESDEDGVWMQFIITGENKGWIAMALSRDAKMGDDDSYICSQARQRSSDITFTSAFNTGTVAPTPVKTDPNVAFQHGTVIDTHLACQFKRRLSITKTVAGTSTVWNLRNETFNLLFAEGEISEQGQFLPHNFARYTHGPLFFLSNNGYKKDEGLISKPQIPLSKIQSLDLSQVIYQDGGYIWIFPAKCEDDCRTLQWKPIMNEGQLAVKFILNASSSGYSGFMITENFNDASSTPEAQLKAFGECYFCYRKDPSTTKVTIGRGNCTFSDLPVMIEELGSNWSPNSTVNGDVLTCSFVRPLSLNISRGSKTVNYDLSAKNYYILYGEGAVSKDGIMQSVRTSSALSEPLLKVNKTNQEYLKPSAVTKLKEEEIDSGAEHSSTTKLPNNLEENIESMQTTKTAMDSSTNRPDNLLNSTDFVVSSPSSNAQNHTSDSATPPRIHQTLLLFQLCILFTVYVV